MNPSFYQNFNYNFSNAQNQSITEIGGKINLKWFDSSVFANYFRIDNFAYFGTDFLPKQSSETVNISQIGGEATLNYWKLNSIPNCFSKVHCRKKNSCQCLIL
jgi:hypothetical protein